MEIVKNTLIEGSHQKPILADVYYKKNNQPKSIVIFCHGYKGFKDWGVFGKMGSFFAENNTFFVKFNFSHNGGTPEQPFDFPDLEAFGQNNFLKELDDLEDVLNWLGKHQGFKKELNFKDITLIGHSRGGGITLLKASEDSRISRLITWASVADFGARFPKGELLETWKKEGVAYIENTRTRQLMPHYIQFYDNFIKNEKRLTIQTGAKRLTIPHLIVHGTLDTTVSKQEAENIHSWNPKSELFLIEGADHVFNGRHPWDKASLPKPFKMVLQKSIQFIKTKE